MRACVRARVPLAHRPLDHRAACRIAAGDVRVEEFKDALEAAKIASLDAALVGEAQEVPCHAPIKNGHAHCANWSLWQVLDQLQPRPSPKPQPWQHAHEDIDETGSPKERVRPPPGAWARRSSDSCCTVSVRYLLNDTGGCTLHAGAAASCEHGRGDPAARGRSAAVLPDLQDMACNMQLLACNTDSGSCMRMDSWSAGVRRASSE